MFLIIYLTNNVDPFQGPIATSMAKFAIDNGMQVNTCPTSVMDSNAVCCRLTSALL